MTSRRSGRPSLAPEQQAQMREKILSCAQRRFAEQGVEAVSMRRIAQDVGCSPMALYRYVGSKQEILRHIWAGFFEALFAELEQIAAATPEPADRLRALCAGYLRYWTRHPEQFCMIFLNVDHTSDSEQHFVDSSDVIERFGLFEQALQQAQLGGEVRAGDARLMGEVLMAGLNGLLLHVVTIPEYPWQRLEASLDQLMMLLWRRTVPV